MIKVDSKNLHEVVGKLRKEKMVDKTQESKEITLKAGAIARIYNDPNLGTECITPEDLAPTRLKVLYATSKAELPQGEAINPGYFHRDDLNQQFKSIRVSFITVKKTEQENFNKTGFEAVKNFYGIFEGNIDPFLYTVRSTALSSASKFLSEVKRIQHKYKLPMYALKVELTTNKRETFDKKTGQKGLVYLPVFTVLKDKDGFPVFETDEGKAAFMRELALNMQRLNPTEVDERAKILTNEPSEQPEIPVGSGKSDIPF
jgi:hypothetical protein